MRVHRLRRTITRIVTMAALVALPAATAAGQDPNPGAPRPPAAASPDEGLPSAGLEPLHLQVLLDRAGFSPGAIDGRTGPSTRRALALYQQHRGVPLPQDVPALVPYVITEADAAGPFSSPIPSDLVEQASLPALGYTSIVEALAERFHTTPRFLQHLNPAARFETGEEIQVPNVEALVVPVERLQVGPPDVNGGNGTPPARPEGTSGRRGAAPASARGEAANAIMQRPDVVIAVSEGASVLTVTDTAGQVVFAAPVTTGSEHDPLPIGEWKVTGLQFNPVFHYNPTLFWDADPSHSKAKIPAGPNNPVGLVWIDLDKEHYGIHGTPEPAAIGRAQSHGCVRLTNWDAVRLASLVKPGTKVVFTR